MSIYCIVASFQLDRAVYAVHTIKDAVFFFTFYNACGLFPCKISWYYFLLMC